jgi:nucleotide-binding universal stress UspA family protein
MNKVFACVGAMQSSVAVCDSASWASKRLDAPLVLLHVLDRSESVTEVDLSGNIGLGSREHLLEELATLDEKRGRLAIEAGKAMLDAAAARARTSGVEAPALMQRHGDLAESLGELEADIRLLVIGLHSTQNHSPGMPVGSHVESVIRTMHRPILAIPGEFSEPKSFMLAFDGSVTTLKGVEMLAASPLCYADENQAGSREKVRTAIDTVQQIYRQNFFPEMKASWEAYPDNIGHMIWQGCFRCHDGRHKTADGRESIKANDCNSCHTILSQGRGEDLNLLTPSGQEFKHPGDEVDGACNDCHTGGL